MSCMTALCPNLCSPNCCHRTRSNLWSANKELASPVTCTPWTRGDLLSPTRSTMGSQWSSSTHCWVPSHPPTGHPLTALTIHFSFHPIAHLSSRCTMSVAFCLLTTLGGYLITSAMLLKFPNLLHKRKQQKFRCRHISHRGGKSALGIACHPPYGIQKVAGITCIDYMKGQPKKDEGCHCPWPSEKCHMAGCHADPVASLQQVSRSRCSDLLGCVTCREFKSEAARQLAFFSKRLAMTAYIFSQ